MKVVLDTNVFISGVFFTGPPHEILKLWRDRRVRLFASTQILDEYRRVGERLSNTYSDVDIEPFLTLVTVYAEIVEAPPLAESVCDDPTDDKFLACALAARAKLIVSGDRHLLKVSGYRGVTVLRPKVFLDQVLKRS